MAKGDREHHADEFGRVGSAAISGADAPTLGAPTMITIDGIVERESGVTPPPPAISVKAIAITLGLMILVGIALLAYISSQPRPNFGLPGHTVAPGGSGPPPSTLVLGRQGVIAPAVGPAGRIRDRRGNVELGAAAIKNARSRFPQIVQGLWDRDRPDAGWPSGPNDVVKHGRPFVIPVYTLVGASDIATGESLFSITKQVPGSFVLGIEYKGRLIYGIDWTTEDGKSFGSQSLVFGPFDISEAERELRAYFNSDHFRVRYMSVGPGMWVVGRHGSIEKAVWIHSGQSERANEPASGVRAPSDLIQDARLPHPEI